MVFVTLTFDEVIGRRRMCRDFSDRPVPAEIVDRLLDRARRAPSAGHTQGWSFLLLCEPADVARFWSAAADPEWLEAPSLPGLLRAPVVVVPWCSPALYAKRYSEPDKASSGLGPEVEAWAVPYWTVDASFATMLLLLGVTAEGLGALFFGRDGPAWERVRSEFGVPAEWEPIGAVAIGWPAGAGAGAGGGGGGGARGVGGGGGGGRFQRWCTGGSGEGRSVGEGIP
jgi:nitroreductase